LPEIAKLPEASPIIFKLRRSDGTSVWLDIQSYALLNTIGDACGLFITVKRLARKAKVSRSAAQEPVS
jgi:hypothetical protein